MGTAAEPGRADHGAGLLRIVPWPVAVAALVILLAIVAAVIWFSPPMERNADACTEVTSSPCRPFLDALYISLGDRGDDIASVRGRPWCGEDACQPIYGGSALRLRVTYYDGTTAEYLCMAGPLDDPVCEPADGSP
jgi:hypothetical protein